MYNYTILHLLGDHYSKFCIHASINPCCASTLLGCQDLILRMLQYEPKQRITIPAILAHPWITMKGLQNIQVVAVPNWLRKEDLDPAILGFMVSDEELSCGHSLEQIVEELTANKATPAAATYHLLARYFQQVMKEEKSRVVRKSVSDYNLSGMDRAGLQSRGSRRRHVSGDQLPPLASQATQADDQGMVRSAGCIESVVCVCVCVCACVRACVCACVCDMFELN